MLLLVCTYDKFKICEEVYAINSNQEYKKHKNCGRNKGCCEKIDDKYNKDIECIISGEDNIYIWQKKEIKLTKNGSSIPNDSLVFFNLDNVPLNLIKMITKEMIKIVVPTNINILLFLIQIKQLPFIDK